MSLQGLREHNVIEISSGCDHCAVLSDLLLMVNVKMPLSTFMVENEPLYANTDLLSHKSDFSALFRSNMRESLERVVQVPNCSKAEL